MLCALTTSVALAEESLRIPDKAEVYEKDGHLYTPGFVVLTPAQMALSKFIQSKKAVTAYTITTDKILMERWQPLTINFPTPPVVKVAIGRKGAFESFTILQTSGTVETDRQFIAAVRDLFPVPPFSEEIIQNECSLIISPKFFLKTTRESMDKATQSPETERWIASLNKAFRSSMFAEYSQSSMGHRADLQILYYVPTGKIIDASILASDGDTRFNNALLKIVPKMEKKLPSAPKLFTADFIPIILSADYSVPSYGKPNLR